MVCLLPHDLQSYLSFPLVLPVFRLSYMRYRAAFGFHTTGLTGGMDGIIKWWELWWHGELFLFLDRFIDVGVRYARLKYSFLICGSAANCLVLPWESKVSFVLNLLEKGLRMQMLCCSRIKVRNHLMTDSMRANVFLACKNIRYHKLRFAVHKLTTYYRCEPKYITNA